MIFTSFSKNASNQKLIQRHLDWQTIDTIDFIDSNQHSEAKSLTSSAKLHPLLPIVRRQRTLKGICLKATPTQGCIVLWCSQSGKWLICLRLSYPFPKYRIKLTGNQTCPRISHDILSYQCRSYQVMWESSPVGMVHIFDTVSQAPNIHSKHGDRIYVISRLELRLQRV